MQVALNGTVRQTAGPSHIAIGLGMPENGPDLSTHLW